MRTLTILLLLAGTVQAQQTDTYRIERSWGDVAAAVERVVNEPRSRPFKMPNLPAIIEGKDIILTTTIDPTRRAYVADMKVKKGRLTFSHKLELWGKPDHYVIRATVDIDWRWGCIGKRIVNRIVSKAECMFLSMERKKVMQYAREIGTPEVELAQDSWAKVFIDAYRLLKRAKELQAEQPDPDIDPNMQRTPEFDDWWTDQSRDVTREYLDHWETAPQWQRDLLRDKEWKR